MDISTITHASASLKNAIDIIKYINDTTKKLENAELRLKIGDLLNIIADIKINIADYKIIINEKNKVINELKKSLEVKHKITKRKDSFYLFDDNNNIIGGPYCSRCWESDYKMISLINDKECNICPQCNIKYLACRSQFTFD